jgi:hypothetical protein
MQKSQWTLEKKKKKKKNFKLQSITKEHIFHKISISIKIKNNILGSGVWEYKSI